MADEPKTTLTDQQTGETVPQTPEYKEGEAEKLEPETPLETAVQEVVQASEDASHTPVAEGFDKAVRGVMKAIESMDGHSESAHTAHSDTVLILGRSITVPGGIYSVVFGALAALTVFEVLVAELTDGGIGTIILVAASILKAVLVVYFYMHLNRDNKVFALALLIPLFMVLVATFFLVAVPSGAY